MITRMLLPVVLFGWLAAGEPAAAPVAAPDPAERASIPDEVIVLELRKARIAGQLGDVKAQRQILDALVAAHPDDPTAVSAALSFHRDADGDTDATRALRTKLLETLSVPGRIVPLPLIQDIARDPKTSAEELKRLVDLLAAQPGAGADRIARLRLRVALLDRLGRREEMTVALEELAAVDNDPFLADRLLGTYREAGRWEDVLRATSRIKGANPDLEVGWWRVEAMARLARYDELPGECAALIGRLKTGLALEPYVAEKFFPIVFMLVDSGRREPAERLVTQLQEAGPDLDNVKELHVMLFGTPEARIAFLEAAAGASLASADPDKIRNEAYQRLLAKDYKTAHELYRRLATLGASAEMDGSDWFNDGLAAIESGAWADAEAAMTHVIEGGLPNARALAHRARAKIMQGRGAEGITDAEAALAIDPKSRQACYAMYIAYQKFGNQEKAAEWLARSKAP